MEAATTLRLLMCQQVGCRDVLQHGGLPALLALLQPPAPHAVRDAAYSVLCAAAPFDAMRSALVQQQGALATLLAAAQQEEPPRSAAALELLHHCVQVRTCMRRQQQRTNTL